MQILQTPISISDLKQMADQTSSSRVKAVVDVEKQQIAVDADMHADLQALLMDNGSELQDMWGINLYPGAFGTDEFIDFDSSINIRPAHGNSTLTIDGLVLQTRIREIVDKMVVPAAVSSVAP